MSDVIEVSYTGDLLAHRRCPRAWAYGNHAGFEPYELVQVMEGRLVHHAMEWLARTYRETGGTHATEQQLRDQLEHYFKVLWARGVRTAFESRADVLTRVMGNLFPRGRMHRTVRAAVEGAQHTEYELRAVRTVLPAKFGGKEKILLTGVVDLVIQQETGLTYPRRWIWNLGSTLDGTVVKKPLLAHVGDTEIWDYKATRATTQYLLDYARQLLTYAALYAERTGELPARCVLFFVNERNEEQRLLAIEVSQRVLRTALKWTQDQVAALQKTADQFELDPESVGGGDFTLALKPPGQRVTSELRQQCTACGLRFDCDEYRASLGRGNHPDVDLLNIFKN